MSFHTILRYQIDPAFHSADRVEELAAFCAASRIEEVMLFITPEELSTGHPTGLELEAYIALGRSLRERLAREGVALSLNPWATVYHNYRGRTLREGQQFRNMVGETGVTNPVAVCPLCETWQAYLSESFATLAREVCPVAIWVEDDFRLRNHDQALLGWGGCFCTEHLARFSERAGCAVGRKELLTAILQPGPPHPWRALWLELSCETLREPLARVSAAIRAASPGTRVGLMSSSPDAHSSEGRKWERFQEAIGQEPAFLTRPNMAPYTQIFALQAVPSNTRLTLANLSGPLEIRPELENSPRCGPYSKSARYTLWQMFNCAALGAGGVTINHFDMMGNGTALDPHFGRRLLVGKARLDALAAECPDDREAGGVEVLFSPQVSLHLHTRHGRSLHEWVQESELWGDVCTSLGIAHRFTSSVEGGRRPVLVNGQTLRAFDDAALRQLLARPLVLDAASVEVLLERGFGAEIGLCGASWQTLSQAAYAYEEIAEDDPAPYGLARPRLSAQRCSPQLLALEPVAEAQELSYICNAEHRALWPGATRFRNTLGGEVVCLTYPVARVGQFFMGFFNPFRRIFLHRLFMELAPTAPLAFAAEHPYHCYRHTVGPWLRLAVLNPCDDTPESLAIDLPDAAPDGWELLGEGGRWQPTQPVREPLPTGMRLRFPIETKYLEGTFLRRLRATE